MYNAWERLPEAIKKGDFKPPFFIRFGRNEFYEIFRSYYKIPVNDFLGFI